MALNPKAVGAAGIAAAAIGVAAWQVTSFTGAGAKVLSAEQAVRLASPEAQTTPPPEDRPSADDVIDGLVDSGAWSPADPNEGTAVATIARRAPADPLTDNPDQTFRFEPPTDLGELTSDLTYAADGAPELATLGRAGKASMIDTWRALVTPLVAGDRDRFLGAASRAGAAPDAAAALFDRLQPALEGAQFDLSKAVTRAVAPDDVAAMPRMPHIPAGINIPGGTTKAVGVPMMMTANQQTDDTGRTTREETLNIPLTGLFLPAEALLAANAPLVEVWTPARLADRRTDTADVGMSVFMAHDRQNNAWVPTALRLNLVSDHARDTVKQALTASRPSRTGAKP